MALLSAFPVLGLSIAFGPVLALAWPVAVAFAVLHARGWARFAAYAYDGRFVAFRAGWLYRQWTVASIEKCQSIALAQSPLDRRNGMADVAIDTAGAGMTAFGLTVPYLAEAEARDLAESLQERLVAAIALDEPAPARAA
jgi:membrane protein YdbS with pleckstrin-like domain